MAFDKPFLHTQEAIASFNFSELTTNRSYIIFYGAATNSAYFLTTEASVKSAYQEDSSKVGLTTVGTVTVASETTFLDKDFDTVFATPNTIEGDLICNITVGINSNAVGNNETANIGFSCEVLKNTTQLVIANTTVADGSLNTSTINFDSAEMTLVLVVPRTHFGIGDTLRFTIKLTGIATSGDDLKCGFAHDPAGRNESLTAILGKIIEDQHSTQLKFLVPFVVNP